MFRLDWVEALMKSPYPTVQKYCALLLRTLITSHSSLKSWRHILQPRRTSRPTNTCDVSFFNQGGHHVLQILVKYPPSTTQDITSYNICEVSSFNHTGHHILKLLVTSHPSHHAGHHVPQILVTSHPSHHAVHHVLQILVTSPPSTTQDITSYNTCDVSSFNHGGHHVLQILVTSHPSTTQDITPYKYFWHIILQPRRASRPTNTYDVTSFNHGVHHVLQMLMTSHPSTTQDITS